MLLSVHLPTLLYLCQVEKPSVGEKPIEQKEKNDQKRHFSKDFLRMSMFSAVTHESWISLVPLLLQTYVIRDKLTIKRNEKSCSNIKHRYYAFHRSDLLRWGGFGLSTPTQTDLNQRAVELLREDAGKIQQLISVQLENLTAPKCPLYEEVLDTQMFGLSREIDFAVRAGLITREQGREIISDLERKLAHLYTLVLPSPKKNEQSERD